MFLITTYLFQFVCNQRSIICRQIVKLFLLVRWSPFTVARALLQTQTGVPGAGKGGRMRCKPGASTRGAVVDLISSYCQIQDTCAKQVHIKQSKWCWYGQEYRVHDRLEVPGACRQEYLVHGRAEVPGACSQEYLLHRRAEIPGARKQAPRALVEAEFLGNIQAGSTMRRHKQECLLQVLLRWKCMVYIQAGKFCGSIYLLYIQY